MAYEKSKDHIRNLIGYPWLLRAIARNASSGPAAGRELSQLQYGRRADALFSLTTGAANTAVGWLSLFSNTDGSFNTAIGAGTLLFNIGNQTTAEGTQNTATGVAALLNNTTGNRNTANGALALFSNTEGNRNTAIGFNTLFNKTTGAGNTAIGDYALSQLTAGSGNTALGSTAGSFVTTASDVICAGAGGENVSNTTWIRNVYGVTTQSFITAPVVVSNGGQLGTVASSERFKKDIATMEKTSEAILALRPVTFHYKSDTRETPQFGLIAEEVAKVNPALVLPDKEGKPYSVRYDAVNAMLLNEFLKARRNCRNYKQSLRGGRKVFRAN